MKRTGGGLFDPAARNIYFAAGEAPTYPKFMLTAVNDLGANAYVDQLEQLLDAGHVVLLDSGIYNLAMEHVRKHGTTHDEALALAPEQIDGFDELFEKYTRITTDFGDRLWGYIELDQGGAVNKRRTRAKLEGMGLAPIPVYHPLVDGWDYFDELAGQYDRICMGNIVQAAPDLRLRLVHTLWERMRAYPNLWVHVLGMTPNEYAPIFNPPSCDSSTWLNGLRYPAVNMGTTALKRGGNCTAEFMYTVENEPNPRGRDVAARVYADEVEAVNDVWEQINNDTRRTFGPIPDPDPREGPTRPATNP